MTEIEDINRCLFSVRPVYQSPTLQSKWIAAVRWLRTSSKRGWVLDRKGEME
jgi:hypothetical protein